MINLLYAIVFAETGLILTLLFSTPFRRLLIGGIDLLKQGRGPLVAKTVAATVLVVFSSILYSVMEIRKRAMDSGAVNATDEVLMAQRLLEASLMGFSIFLAIMIDRLHYYMKELYLMRKELENMKRSQQSCEDKTSSQMEGTKEANIKQQDSMPKIKADEAMARQNSTAK